MRNLIWAPEGLYAFDFKPAVFEPVHNDIARFLVNLWGVSHDADYESDLAAFERGYGQVLREDEVLWATMRFQAMFDWATLTPTSVLLGTAARRWKGLRRVLTKLDLTAE